MGPMQSYSFRESTEKWQLPPKMKIPFLLFFSSVISSFWSKVNFWIPGLFFCPTSSLLKNWHFYLFRVGSVPALLLVQPVQLVLALLLFQSSTSADISHSDGDGNNQTSKSHPGQAFDEHFVAHFYTKSKIPSQEKVTKGWHFETGLPITVWIWL